MHFTWWDQRDKAHRKKLYNTSRGNELENVVIYTLKRNKQMGKKQAVGYSSSWRARRRLISTGVQLSERRSSSTLKFQPRLASAKINWRQWMPIGVPATAADCIVVIAKRAILWASIKCLFLCVSCLEPATSMYRELWSAMKFIRTR